MDWTILMAVDVLQQQWKGRMKEREKEGRHRAHYRRASLPQYMYMQIKLNEFNLPKRRMDLRTV